MEIVVIGFLFETRFLLTLKTWVEIVKVLCNINSLKAEQYTFDEYPPAWW